MSEDVVLVKREKRICTVVMNRPGIMNALNLEMVEELARVLKEVSKDVEIRVVILEGAGENFSTGADLSLLAQDFSGGEWLDAMKKFGELVSLIREIPQPVISKVRGAAVGGGCSIALAGDFVVAARDTKFRVNFVHIGAVLDGGATYFLPRLVGLVKAREIALLGEFFDGEKAEAMGLIYRSVPAENLDREVNLLAGTLASKTPRAVSLIKEGLEESLGMSMKQVLEWEASHQSIMFQTPEHKEIVGMFLESRGK